jgi:CRP/FNR family transcriptional regulator, cyclic AMP receptor protein
MSPGEPSEALTGMAALGLAPAGWCDDLATYLTGGEHGAELVEDLSEAEANALGAMMPKVRAQAGQVLIREGDVGNWMLLLLQGTADVCKATDTGELSRLAVIKFGAAVGEMSMLDNSPRFATVTAIEDVVAGVISRATMARLIREHPAIGAKLLVKLTQLLARRLRNTSNQVVKMVQERAAASKL